MKLSVFALLAVFIFLKKYFTNLTLYWCLYGLAFVLLILLWFVMYWVGKKRAQAVIGENLKFSCFCSKVPAVVTDDFIRGRFCIGDKNIYLVRKNHGKYSIEWQIPADQVDTVDFGTVAQVRKGFTIRQNGDYSIEFACARIIKRKNELNGALGREIENV